ncbi:hypothetical protein Droror1_Dr00017614 [Drosera rotundifolia]
MMVVATVAFEVICGRRWRIVIGIVRQGFDRRVDGEIRVRTTSETVMTAAVAFDVICGRRWCIVVGIGGIVDDRELLRWYCVVEVTSTGLCSCSGRIPVFVLLF